MINPIQLKELVIQPTLEAMEPVFPGASNPAAVNLLLGTAVHESTIGGVTYLKQQNGPALGIYQIEPATEIDIWENFLSFRNQSIVDEFKIGCSNELLFNLKYSTAIARLIYYRQNFDWCDPDDIAGLAAIWKKWFNTPLGKGTMAQFIDHYPDML